MTLKLNPDLDIMKEYHRTESEVARSSHSKYIAWNKKDENNSQGQRSRSRSNDIYFSNHFSVHYGAYSYQISGQ